MSFLNDLSCPQYLDFRRITEFDMSKSPLSDTNTSPYSAKDDMEAKSMDMDVSDSVPQYLSESTMCTTMTSPYSVNNSYQGSVGETESSYGKENFPVNRPRNLLSDQNGNKKSKARKNNKTVVKPFSFEGRKRKRDEEKNEEVIPLAEQVIAFHKKTPERFHTTGKKVFEPTEHWSPVLVRPKSPNLQAAKRRRSIHCLSREQQEAKEAEEIKNYRFRARPLKESLLRNPRLPKVARKLPTRPKEFPLKTAQRAAENNARTIEEEESFEFHARPVPKAILEGPVGLKEKPVIPATVPKTPNFALKTRAAKWKSENKLNIPAPESSKFKAAPAPAPTSNFAIKHEKKRTEIQPFSFDIKDKERIAKKEQKIAEIIEEETKPFVFKAQMMPSPTQSSLPAAPKRLPTRPQPFNLHSEFKTSRQNLSTLSQESECSVFKAQPATVLHKPPFVPEKPPKQPVEIEEFQLHTNIRASERLKLKAINDEKEREKELALQRLREIKEAEERKEIMKLREEIVHKANPIRHYKPVEIKPSDKPLTKPKSPKFFTDQRLQSKNMTD